MPEASRFWLKFFVLLSLSFAIAAINLHDPWRESVRNFLLPNKREVLAKAKGDLTGTGRSFTVLKVKTQDVLTIEVFENDPNTNKSLFRTRAILPERRDGFFMYKGNTTNLLLLDVDNDKALEIIAPGFDENLVARVHIFKFNDGTNSLETLGPDSIKF